MTALTTPVGRLVWGHPLVLVQKKDQKKQPVMKDGKPVMVRQFGVAFDKAAFNAVLWPVMYAEAMTVFPGGVPQHFAYKFKDGDGMDRQGKSYATREGYAGHCVINFETQYDIAAFRPSLQNPGGWDQITERDFKTGDYIAVNVDMSANKPVDPTHTPGLYINPRGVLHIGNGAAIVNAPSADAMFAGQQFALPPGAMPAGSAPQMPQGMATPPAAPAYGAPPAAPAYGAPPAAPAYQPAPDFVPGYQAPAAPQPGQAPPYGQPPQGFPQR